MEGHRLILKRKIPKGRQTLVAIFAGAFAVAGLVMIGQLKTTLSAHALEAVKTDVTNMRTQFESSAASVSKDGENVDVPSTPSTDPADTAVEKFKKLLQDTPATTP